MKPRARTPRTASVVAHPKESGGGRCDLLHPRQPQRQLAIWTDVAIHEVLQHWRHAASLKTKAAQDFLRDGVRDVFGAVGRPG